MADVSTDRYPQHIGDGHVGDHDKQGNAGTNAQCECAGSQCKQTFFHVLFSTFYDAVSGVGSGFSVCFFKKEVVEETLL